MRNQVPQVYPRVPTSDHPDAVTIPTKTTAWVRLAHHRQSLSPRSSLKWSTVVVWVAPQGAGDQGGCRSWTADGTSDVPGRWRSRQPHWL